jgi:hypothetical protein
MAFIRGVVELLIFVGEVVPPQPPQQKSIIY